jgi:hypothetical protein
MNDLKAGELVALSTLMSGSSLSVPKARIKRKLPNSTLSKSEQKERKRKNKNAKKSRRKNKK